MATPYTTWTVNPHDPIETFADNLWRVNGTFDNGKVQRCMVAARLQDGRVLLHNPIALSDEEMAKLDAWGEVAGILVPNSFHRMDARIMKDRYPKAKVYCPAGGAKGVGKIVPVDGSFDEVPRDATVEVRHLDGVKQKEGVMLVRSGDALTATFCDTVMNHRKPLPGMIGFMLAPTGEMGIPRAMRWFLISDKRALKADLERIAGLEGFARLIPGHGVVADQPADNLRHAATILA